MKKCIFCCDYKHENEFNKEHIILEALGGKGKEDICSLVCSACNSKLGSRVDACLTNHIITKYYRYIWKIKGKNGTSNPFKGIKINYADTNIKGELIIDKKGTIVGFRADHQIIEIGDKLLILGPRSGFCDYVNSQLKKNNMPQLSPEEIYKNKLSVKKPKYPHIDYFLISEEGKNEYLITAFPVLLKMAYVFCCEKLGDNYMEDKCAVDIRVFLNNFNYRKGDSYYSPVDARLEWIGNETRTIIFSVYREKLRIFVKILLYGLVECVICMSDVANMYEDFEKITLEIAI